MKRRILDNIPINVDMYVCCKCRSIWTRNELYLQNAAFEPKVKIISCTACKNNNFEVFINYEGDVNGNSISM